MGEPLVTTADGWTTHDRPVCRLVVEHAAPRPFGYRDQLRIDARGWRPLALWAVAAGGLAYGLWTRTPPAVALGGAVLGVYLVMLRGTVRPVRDGPTAVGVVDALRPHPLTAGYSAGTATLADGGRLPVALPTRLVAPILDRDGRAEVIFLHTPQSQYSLIYGVRPVVPARSSGSG